MGNHSSAERRFGRHFHVISPDSNGRSVIILTF